jgi:hypothetical protein
MQNVRRGGKEVDNYYSARRHMYAIIVKEEKQNKGPSIDSLKIN